MLRPYKLVELGRHLCDQRGHGLYLVIQSG